MADITIKTGDLLPSITGTLKDQSGAVLSLVGFTVKLRWRLRGSSNVVLRSADIVDAAAGEVRYDWQSGDTDIQGVYDMEWAATYTASGAPRTFPTRDYFTVEMVSRLGSAT